MNIRTGEAYPLGTFYKQEKEPIEKELTNNLDLLTDRVCLKLFSGDLSLTPKERLALLMWGTKIGKEGCQRIADFLTEVVVPTNPEAAQAPALIQSLLADKGNGFVLSYIKSLERKGLLMQDTAARLTALVDKNADNNLPIELLKRLIHYSA